MFLSQEKVPLKVTQPVREKERVLLLPGRTRRQERERKDEKFKVFDESLIFLADFSSASPPSLLFFSCGKARRMSLPGTGSATSPIVDAKRANGGAILPVWFLFDRERRKKAEGEVDASLQRRPLWLVVSKRWLQGSSLSSPASGNRNRNLKVIERRERRALYFSSPSSFVAARRRRRRFFEVIFFSLFLTFASVDDQFPFHSSPTRAPLTQGEFGLVEERECG